MHTLSGRRFEIGTEYAPTVKDVAIGLSRIPRWAGATVRPWSVLQHSLAAGALVEVQNDPYLHLAALVHDMEEMATGDIPSPFKTKTQRELGERMREWLFRATLGLPYPREDMWERVHQIDTDLKLAELMALCHPRSWNDPYFNGDVTEFVNVVDAPTPWQEQIMRAIDAVWELIDMDEREQIVVFTDQVVSLVNSKRLQSLVRKL